MVSKIKILFVVVSLKIGGTERTLTRIAGFLDKNKYDISVCCLGKKGVFSSELEKEVIKIYYFNIPEKPFFLNLFLHIVGIYRLFWIIIKNRFALVHSFLFRANVLTRISAKIACVRVSISSVRMTMKIPKIFILIDYVTSYLNDKITANCRAVRDFTINYSHIRAKNVVTIYNGIDIRNLPICCDSINRENDSLEGSLDPNVAIIGRLSVEKGHKYFLESAKLIKGSYPNVKFFIIGDGYRRKDLENLSRDLKIQNSVVFRGEVKNIFDYLDLFDVVVSSSVSEGMSNAILEAMAMEKPIVATSVGGTPEMVIDGVNGFLVPPKDPEALALKILILLKDKELRLKMGKEGRKIVEQKFDIKYIVQKTEKLYDTLLRKKGVLSGRNKE